VRIRVDEAICQGHGRCYAVAPDLFEPDDLGSGHEMGDGTVASDDRGRARLAAANCPERAIVIDDDINE